MKHVLLPIDGSTRSLRTIDMVQQTYRPQDTEVTLLMVLPDQMHIDGQFARDRMARKAAQELETFAALLPGWTVRTELLWGSPGPEIVYYARERGFDALVMTRSSRGPLQKLGSVATYVVRNAQFLDLIIMREAADWISQTLRVADGWLIGAECAAHIHAGCHRVLAMQPFGCLPNHVCGRGQYAALLRRLGRGKVVSVDLDASLPRLLVYNRVKLLLEGEG